MDGDAADQEPRSPSVSRRSGAFEHREEAGAVDEEAMKVCLSTANTLTYPQGGHLWVFLNWALGLRANGCEVVWLDAVKPETTEHEIAQMVATLRERIGGYGFADSIAITSLEDEDLPFRTGCRWLPLEAALDADLMLDLRYDLPASTVSRFRRTAALDIDPGLLQYSLSIGYYRFAPHDVYFTIGETVGTPSAKFTDAGLPWRYLPPCVSVEHWPVCGAAPNAPFTTVSHWYGEWMVEPDGSYYVNDKRAGFAPFLDIPRLTPAPFELALDLADDESERAALEAKGWRVRQAHATTASPADFQAYIQQSRGEFSCCKPSYVKWETAWLSDRTLCYLASGKPTIVQHTGASRFLPDAAGLFRFRDVDEARRHVETVVADYPHQCALARSLAEEYFDAPKVAGRLLEDALS